MFIGKHLFWSLFNNVAGLKAENDRENFKNTYFA